MGKEKQEDREGSGNIFDMSVTEVGRLTIDRNC